MKKGVPGRIAYFCLKDKDNRREKMYASDGGVVYDNFRDSI